MLRLIYDLRRHGAKKMIVLRGNHEEMLLEWLDACGIPRAEGPDGRGLMERLAEHRPGLPDLPPLPPEPRSSRLWLSTLRPRKS